MLHAVARTLFLGSAAIGIGCGTAHDSQPSDVSVETLNTALAERDELERTYQLTRFLRTLRPEDVPAALEAIENHRVGISPDEVRLFMLAWTRIDGPGAFAAARDWPTPWKTVLMEQAMRAWGFNDGKAALASAEAIEDVELRDRLLVSVTEGWVSSYDPLGAAEYAASLTEQRRRNRLAFRLAGETMRDGPEAVIAWVEAIPEDTPNDFKQFAFYHGVGAVAKVDPERAARFYKQHMEQAYSSTGLRNIATKWVQHHDPGEFIVWIQALEIDEEREDERGDAIGTAVRKWGREDPDGAQAWLESQLPNPALDSAIAEMARVLSDTVPEAAVAWAGRIKDEADRRKFTIRAARSWLKKAPADAQAWIASSDLPTEWKQQLAIKPPRKGGRPKKAGRGRPRGRG